MPKKSHADLIVVGGGPAGTTVATLIKLNRPSARVVLLEREKFPRHHVGESLLPGILPVLKETGAYDRIERAGFVRKIGVTFVWGKDRKPWDADFSELKFNLHRKGQQADFDTTWQVLRSDYDALLLDHARDSGVEVRIGSRALAPVERDGAITGVRVARTDGTEEILSCRTLVDCSGQAGFLSKYRPVRRYREDLKNVAVYGYFRDAPWKFRYTGSADASRIFVCSVPDGWFWYIPVAKDLVSVGLVAKAAHVRARGVKDMRAFFLDAIRGCPEISSLLEGRPLAKAIDPADPMKDLFTISDWSYESRTAAGPGWFAAGDAAFFVDPLLSSGVMMAHLSGQRCAYTVLTQWAGAEDKALSRALLADYNVFCRDIGDGFLKLVKIWYEHDPSARNWFKAAARHIRSRSNVSLSDHSSFLSLITGLDHYFERAYVSGGSALTNASGHGWRFRSPGKETHLPVLFLTGGAPKAWSGGVKARNPADPARVHRTVRLLGTRRVGPGFILIEGTGELGSVLQVQFRKKGRQGQQARRLLPSVYATVFSALARSRTVAAAAAFTAERHALPAALIRREALVLADDLVAAGVAVYGAARRGAVKRRGRGPLADLRGAEEALERADAASAERLATRAARGPGRAWALTIRALARESLGRVAEAGRDLDDSLAAAGAAAKHRKTGIPGLRSSFDAAVERGWLEISILEARSVFHARHGRAERANADRKRLDELEVDRDAARVAAQGSQGA